MLKRAHTDEEKRKISKALKEWYKTHQCPMKGRHHSRETKLKMSLVRRGSENYHWKGGRTIEGRGYIFLWVSQDSFFHPMADRNSYILEHRLVMARHLNRCLLAWEVVHHKGTKYPLGSKENKSDNRIENLELLPTDKAHLVDRISRSLITRLQKRLILLEAENKLLRGDTYAKSSDFNK